MKNKEDSPDFICIAPVIIDSSYALDRTTDPVRQEKELIISVIERAFWDAIGNVGCENDQRVKKFWHRSAIKFLNNEVKVDWGESEKLTCSQLCLIATGSDRLRFVLNEYVKNRSKSSIKLLNHGIQRKYFEFHPD